ncbi:pigment dispersing hormone related peptide precursor 79 - penaeid shrimp (Penaeus sp.) [Penaeus vannamei]|uniref:Pigment dispersing hormone related peptide 79-penaeid shrimp (Penaeus sp.) n=1 Tax=Penaeus vannamei TaxID=6689 RepID=A0A3R7LTS8_PENVA|nr:pigment dispersing hormone related peptide precursor 79 - penaeid shrimp (Penaeus sp.) [Penaeus vannamei]
MHRAVVAALLVVVVMSLQQMASGETLKHYEREVVSELAAQILRVAQGPSAFVAGPHNATPNSSTPSWGSQGHERRREEINSEGKSTACY